MTGKAHVRTTDELIDSNMIVKHYAGSIAYGMTLPSSDVDIRGVFCADPVNILTPFFPIQETSDGSSEDCKLFELTHFLDLALKCNPNVIETLWVDPTDIIFKSPAYDILRDARHQLLSKQIADTTMGYAISQLKRIKGHKKWITNPQSEEPPHQTNYVKLIRWLDGRTEPFNIHNFYSGYRLVKYYGHVYGLHKMENYTTYNENTHVLNTNSEHVSIADLDTPIALVSFDKDEYKSAKDVWSGYWNWKNNRNEARAQLEEKFTYDCYSDDTEFLTVNGWKKYDEIDDQELLATFNRFTHKIEYQPITERFESYYTGNMYQLKGYHVDAYISGNHKLFVRDYSRTNSQGGTWNFVSAARLPETFDTLNTIVPRKNRQFMPSEFNTNVLRYVDFNNYLRLIGWFISDGTINFDQKGNVSKMMISQSKPQSKLTQTLNRQINNGKLMPEHYFCEARGYSSYPENRWIFNCDIARLLYNDCGHSSNSKRLPKWCFFLSKREMTILLTALLQGDGHQRNHQNHTHVYYTSNKKLADDVQRLAFLCGFETSLYGPYYYESTFGGYTMQQVHINMRPPKTRRHVRSKSVKKTPVQNKRIVCFMVNNYTLVTRRNGHIGLHGNTKHAAHLVRLLRMGEEALRDGVVNVKREDAQELLDIRYGKWTYDELVNYADKKREQINQLKDKSSLRAKPDRHVAAQVTIEVMEQIWNTNF